VVVDNVPSYRCAAGVTLEVPGFGSVVGDVAWGGNWVFLIEEGAPPVARENLPGLLDFGMAVRSALRRADIRGDTGHEVDHVEICGPPGDPARADSRNFVLCPGGAYDRSPCGTGTSARLACLAADGELAPGEIWRQAGILDSVFEASFERLDATRILPRIAGRAWVIAESTYHFDPTDPFRNGIPTLQPHP
jgi:4-hydroxyproline epimerase